MKKLVMLLIVAIFFAACEKLDPVADLEGDVRLKSAELVGAHFNLNIIGVKDKVMNDISGGNVIFVDLNGTSQINLQQGDVYAVLDKNGTDEDGALLQLPYPGFEPYVTELPWGFDTDTEYSVYARPLGKPDRSAVVTTEATLTELSGFIAETEDKKNVRLWNNLVDEYGEALTIVWGDFVPNPVTFERVKGKSTFQNVTAELLSVVYEIEVYYDDLMLTFHVRIPIFDPLLEGEYWKYENNGLKLLQLRFYPFGTDVTDDDIEKGWGPTE